MLNIDEYRPILRERLPERAFLRLSRTKGLFVSDAPRFDDKKDFRIRGYIIQRETNLIYITPELPDVPAKCRETAIVYLKSDNETKSYIARTGLAQAMRQHDEESMRFFKFLLETEDGL